MSKAVKNLMIDSFQQRLDGVTDCFIVGFQKLNAEENHALRMDARGKGIEIMMIRNNLSRIAFKNVGLEHVSQYVDGPAAVIWGGEGSVELAREIAEWSKKLANFEIKGGATEGVGLDAGQVQALSKMPSRVELLGRIAGMLLAPAAQVAAQAMGPAAAVLSQVKRHAGEDVDGAAMAVPMEAETEVEEEQTEFDVVLTGSGDKKIQVIKIVRAATDLGLKEAKALVDALPATVKEALSKEDAEKLKAEIEEAGGAVELK